MNNRFVKILLLFSVCLYGVGESFLSQAYASTKPLNIKAETNVANLDIVVKDNFIKAKYASAEKRFLQGNIKASYDDFADIIDRASHDDYVFLKYAMKMAEYGFFDLVDALINKLDSNLYTQNYVADIKKYYYPSSLMKTKDTVYFADAYASIVYNNLAIETTSELLSTTRVADNDYKSYLIALGYYKSNNLPQALKYINNAIVQNDSNVNYKVLKAKILADSGKQKQALKVLKQIQDVDFLAVEFQEKTDALNEYINYKLAKNEIQKDYHLSYYYHLQGKSLLATKVLQSVVLQAKDYSSKIFGLLSRIYYENNEPLKAQEFAQRAYKENSKNYLAVLTLADLNFDERKIEEALGYYKIAKKAEKRANAPVVGIAKCYLALDNEKKSKKMYEKLLKQPSYDEDLLISSLKLFPHRSDDYLSRVASVDIMNNEIWLGLAQLAIRDGNFSMAETFLNNSYYIDENNYKYYYYLSLVLKSKGEVVKANQSLVKCSRLNSDYAASVNMRQGAYEK